MGEFRQIDYFLVNDEAQEVIQVLSPGETQAPSWWTGQKYRQVNTWNGIDEVADIILEYKFISYSRYYADKKAKKLEASLQQEVKV